MSLFLDKHRKTGGARLSYDESKIEGKLSYTAAEGGKKPCICWGKGDGDKTFYAMPGCCRCFVASDYLLNLTWTEDWYDRGSESKGERGIVLGQPERRWTSPIYPVARRTSEHRLTLR